MELDFGKPVPGSVRQGAQAPQWLFYHFCWFTLQVWKGDRDPFSQLPAHQGRAKAAESHQGLLWRAIKSCSWRACESPDESHMLMLGSSNTGLISGLFGNDPIEREGSWGLLRNACTGSTIILFHQEGDPGVSEGFSLEMALQCLRNIILVWFPAPPGYSPVSMSCRHLWKCQGGYQILKSLSDVNTLFI